MAVLGVVQFNANINDRGMSVETMAATIKQSLIAHGWSVNGNVKVDRSSINVAFYDRVTVVCTIHSTLDLATLREWFVSNLQTEGYAVGGVTVTILSTTAAGKKALAGGSAAPTVRATPTAAPAPVVTADSATLQAILAAVSAPKSNTAGGSFNSFAAGLGISTVALGAVGVAVLVLVLSRR